MYDQEVIEFTMEQFKKGLSTSTELLNKSEIRNYKTMIDTLEVLAKIITKETIYKLKEFTYTQVNKVVNELTKLSRDTLSDLEFHATKIRDIQDNALQNNEYREYRELVLAVQKLYNLIGDLRWIYKQCGKELISINNR